MLVGGFINLRTKWVELCKLSLLAAGSSIIFGVQTWEWYWSSYLTLCLFPQMYSFEYMIYGWMTTNLWNLSACMTAWLSLFSGSVRICVLMSVHRLLGIMHSLNVNLHLKKQPQMLVSTLFWCYFLSVSFHNSLIFLFGCSLLQCPRAVWKPASVLKQSAVPSGDVWTFIYNKTLGETHLVFPYLAPNSIRVLFGFTSSRPAQVFSAQMLTCQYIWCSDSPDICVFECVWVVAQTCGWEGPTYTWCALSCHEN